MKLPPLILLLLTLVPASAFAEVPPSDLVGNTLGRQGANLDGTWNVIVDPYETGLNARFYENRKAQNKSDLIEYNFDSSGTLKVPGDWNSQRDTLLFYEGPVWYQKSFNYHRQPNKRVFLYFGSANYLARVWLNGKKLGEHQGGFTPFNFEVTQDVADGENSVVVEVNNVRHADAVPALATDWWNYGGLTRRVKLIEVPETFIQNYSVQLAKGSLGQVSGWVKLNGANASQTVTVEIPEAGLKNSVSTGNNGYAEFHFPAKLQLWSPDSPKLYRVRVSIPGDAIEEPIGFRTIATRGTQILLNGKPIFLRGISMHEEAPYRGGRAFSEDDDRLLLGWVKDLGCNFARLAHYPHNEKMARVADQIGLLLWEEIPVYWDTAWQHPETLANAESQMRDLISRDQNRASVILWSLSNETAPNPDRTEFLKAFATYTRTLDDTRLLTSAMNRTENQGDVRSLNDPLGEYLDVLGLNEYIGWYEHRPEDADHTEWKERFAKPLIVSEFGGGALYGKHGDAETRWTEEYQANLFEHQLNMWRKAPFLAGMSPWLLMDFRSPRRFLPGIQDFYNRKGLISDRGERKQAFYVLQKFYRENPLQPK